MLCDICKGSRSFSRSRRQALLANGIHVKTPPLSRWRPVRVEKLDIRGSDDKVHHRALYGPGWIMLTPMFVCALRGASRELARHRIAVHSRNSEHQLPSPRAPAILPPRGLNSFPSHGLSPELLCLLDCDHTRDPCVVDVPLNLCRDFDVDEVRGCLRLIDHVRNTR